MVESETGRGPNITQAIILIQKNAIADNKAVIILSFLVAGLCHQCIKSVFLFCKKLFTKN